MNEADDLTELDLFTNAPRCEISACFTIARNNLKDCILELQLPALWCHPDGLKDVIGAENKAAVSVASKGDLEPKFENLLRHSSKKKRS